MPRGVAAVTCSATARSTGQRCKRPAIRGGSVCRIHGGLAPAVQAKAARRLADAKVHREFAKWQAQREAEQAALAPWAAEPAIKLGSTVDRYVDPKWLRMVAAEMNRNARKLRERAASIERIRKEQGAST